MGKKLGKIKSVYVGLGGYQDVCLGIHLSFDFDGCGCGTSKSTWDPTVMECSERCQWTEEGRSEDLDGIMRYISQLLADAKVDRVEKLQGKPVEVILDGNTFKEFRILTEVL